MVCPGARPCRPIGSGDWKTVGKTAARRAVLEQQRLHLEIRRVEHVIESGVVVCVLPVDFYASLDQRIGDFFVGDQNRRLSRVARAEYRPMQRRAPLCVHGLDSALSAISFFASASRSSVGPLFRFTRRLI